MRIGTRSSEQNSSKIEITARNYYGGKIIMRSKPSLDVENARNDSRLIAIFGQAEVNTKMTALAQGYEDIDIPKQVKGLGFFCAMLAVGLTITAISSEGVEAATEGGNHHGDGGHHEDDEEFNIDLPPYGIFLFIMFFSNAIAFFYLLWKKAQGVVTRQEELVRNVFAKWIHKGVGVRYDPGRGSTQHHNDEIPATVILQLPETATLQQAMPTMMVEVPMGALPGSQLSVQMNGSMMSAVIPPDCQPGSSFPVQVPGPASTMSVPIG